MPKYLHPPCSGCKFIGTYFDHDVYLHESETKALLKGSIIARYGSEPWEYASTPVMILMDNCTIPERTIGGSGMETMPYQDYVFSTYCNPAERAMILALAIEKMKALV